MIFDIPPAFPSWIQPDNGDWWITSDSGKLTFSVKEAAKIFFGKSGSWLRMRLQPVRDPADGERHPMGWFTEEDVTVPLQVNRVQGRAETYEFRRFTLRDIERMIWSLYRHEVIEQVWWYGSMRQTGKRGVHRLERYNEMMADSIRRLETGIELVKWMGRAYGLVPMPVTVIVEPFQQHSLTGICTLHPERPRADVGLCRACVEQGLFDALVNGSPR